jgi:hypothetical protein
MKLLIFKKKLELHNSATCALVHFSWNAKILERNRNQYGYLYEAGITTLIMKKMHPWLQAGSNSSDRFTTQSMEASVLV